MQETLFCAFAILLDALRACPVSEGGSKERQGLSHVLRNRWRRMQLDHSPMRYKPETSIFEYRRAIVHLCLCSRGTGRSFTLDTLGKTIFDIL